MAILRSDPLDPHHPETPVGPSYAGFWIRLAAHVIDALIIFAVSFAVVLLLFGGLPQPDPATAPGATIDLIAWLVVAIAVVAFWRMRGATPGKMLCGLRIVDSTTLGPLSTGQCIGRYLAYIVSALPLFLGYLWVAVDRRKQGFHDKLASTFVVRENDLADALARIEGQS